MTETKRQCWKCTDRQLICDSTHPRCTNCSSTSISCPGYIQKKPITLRWLAPGEVSSRNLRKPRRENPAKKAAGSTIEISAKAPALGWQFNDRTLRVFVEASDYYNNYLYPGITPIREVSSDFTICFFTPEIFQISLSWPEYVRLITVCASLGHQMCQDETRFTALEKKFLHYRGLMINGLRDDISTKDKSTSNSVIAGILTVLFIDAMQGVSHTMWRYHFGAISKIINLRGGIHELAKSGGGNSMVFSYFLFSLMGDTTSPVTDLFMTPEHAGELEVILNQYGRDAFLFSVFPKKLLASILRINLLRAQWAQKEPTAPEELTQEELMILGVILDFSPENWVRSKPGTYNADRFLLGTIHQAAVALYCICSLQSLFILPPTSFLARLYIRMTECLHKSLVKALEFQKFRKLLLWPLVVLGMAAAGSDEDVRAFVREQLINMGHSTGTYAPFVAKRIFERFWASGKKFWDDCFDEPYMFIHYGGLGLDLKNITSGA